MPAVIIALSLLAAVAFLVAGAQKILLRSAVTTPMRRLRVPDGLTRVIGLLELAGAGGLVAGIWVEAWDAAAAIGLAALLVGAIAYHLRAGDYRNRRYRASAVAPIVLLVVVGSAAILSVGYS